MKFFRILLVIGIALHLSYCRDMDTSHKESVPSKTELVATIDEFNNAFQQGNVSVLKSMITENYVHTNGSSQSIGKKDWLKYLSKRENDIKTGNLEVLQYEMDDMKIEFYGEMAIVTGRVAVSNKEKEETHNAEYRVTHVWINDHGDWKRAGFHDGKIP